MASYALDVEDNEAPLRERIEILESLSKQERWSAEKLTREIRRSKRQFHTEALDFAASQIRLDPKNVAECKAKLMAKFPD